MALCQVPDARCGFGVLMRSRQENQHCKRPSAVRPGVLRCSKKLSSGFRGLGVLGVLGVLGFIGFKCRVYAGCLGSRCRMLRSLPSYDRCSCCNPVSCFLLPAYVCCNLPTKLCLCIYIYIDRYQKRCTYTNSAAPTRVQSCAGCLAHCAPCEPRSGPSPAQED